MTDMEIPQAAIEGLALVIVRAQSGRLWDQYTQLTRDLLVDNCLHTAREALTAALPHLHPSEVLVVHHHDIEKHAASFNEGYDEANRQGIGGEASRNWLTEKVWPLLKDHIEPENSHHVADQIADALLSEADLSERSEAETKALMEAAARVGYALGRKEALTEAAEALDLKRDQRSYDETVGDWSEVSHGGVLLGMKEAASLIRNLASQLPQAVSNGLAASPASPSTPEDSEAHSIRIPKGARISPYNGPPPGFDLPEDSKPPQEAL